MYEQIAKNKKDTKILVSLFIVLLGILGLLIGVVEQYTEKIVAVYNGHPFEFNFGRVLVAGFIIAVLASLYALYMDKHATRVIMRKNHAIRVTEKDHPQLIHIVEDLALAGNLPMPEVYIVADNTANAFATGRNPKNSAVAVTSGLLKIMNRAEMEGVLGHEMSHIKNYDVRLTTMSVSLTGFMYTTSTALFGIAEVVMLSMGNMRDDSDSRDSSILGAMAGMVIGGVLMMASFVVSAVLLPIAKILQFALSRNRESLADASSVDLTRNPLGLLSALEKLQQLSNSQSKVLNKRYSALYINVPRPKKRFLRAMSNLYSTHPSLDKRIASLEKMMN